MLKIVKYTVLGNKEISGMILHTSVDFLEVEEAIKFASLENHLEIVPVWQELFDESEDIVYILEDPEPTT